MERLPLPKVARAGATFALRGRWPGLTNARETPVNAIIYLVGLVVIVMFILSFVGLR